MCIKRYNVTQVGRVCKICSFSDIIDWKMFLQNVSTCSLVYFSTRNHQMMTKYQVSLSQNKALKTVSGQFLESFIYFYMHIHWQRLLQNLTLNYTCILRNEFDSKVCYMYIHVGWEAVYTIFVNEICCWICFLSCVMYIKCCVIIQLRFLLSNFFLTM